MWACTVWFHRDDSRCQVKRGPYQRAFHLYNNERVNRPLPRRMYTRSMTPFGHKHAQVSSLVFHFSHSKPSHFTTAQQEPMDDIDSTHGFESNHSPTQRGVEGGNGHGTGITTCEGHSWPGARNTDPFSLSPFRFVDSQVLLLCARVLRHMYHRNISRLKYSALDTRFYRKCQI